MTPAHSIEEIHDRGKPIVGYQARVGGQGDVGSQVACRRQIELKARPAERSSGGVSQIGRELSARSDPETLGEPWEGSLDGARPMHREHGSKIAPTLTPRGLKRS